MGDVPDLVDVIVIGFGGAGAAAALRAHELGSSVVIVEKQPRRRHTPSTRMSGGLVMAVNDVVAATEYLDRCAGAMTPRDVSAAWAHRAGDLLAWLTEHTGLTFDKVNGAEHPEFEGADSIGVYQSGGATFRLDPRAGGGVMLFDALAAAVERAGIPVVYDAPVRRLVTDAGRVTGVEIGTSSGTETIGARHGVVLACGGFEYDDQLKLNHLRAWPVHFYGNPGNTGDGVKMAQQVGADMWHMNQMIGRAIGHFPLGDEWLNFIIAIDPPGYVITDKHGERYANEKMQAQLLHGFYYEMLHFDSEKAEYPRVPSYWFFDETRRLAGPLTLSHIGAVRVGLYDWSADNSREIERGWIGRGSSIEEAARAAGMPNPEAAAATVARYNEVCRTGADWQGRPADTMIALTNPPHYCVPLYPGGSNTSGGPRRDAGGRVLNPWGEAIPGLYAAGELGQVLGMLYPADGANLSDAFCFGQLAAETALGDAR